MTAVPILFEDEHLFVVAKPAGILVVDAPGRRGPTLVQRVEDQVAGRVYAVHRLDEETTGVLLLARTPAVRQSLDDLLAARQVERVYRAAVGRVPSPAAGRIESRIEAGRDGIVRSIDHPHRGKRAVTNFRTLERRDFGALLECRLETGRRNQIRVHLADLDCPILGDRKYGWRASKARGGRAPARTLLHAAEIGFDHPVTGAAIRIEHLADEAELRLSSEPPVV